MALMEKKRHREKRFEGQRAQRRVYKKRRPRTGLFVFVGLVVLTLIALIFQVTDLTSQLGSGVVERVEEPTVAEAPEAVSSGEEAAEEETATEEEEAAPTPPDDPTLYLSIPKLGISHALVANDEVGLELGVMHLPETGFPWEKGANTYIAGHRLGFPGTGSDHIFFDLPSLGQGDEIILTDANGHSYKYLVSEILQVDPTDMSVTGPTGRDTVSLQTCIENYGDFTTLGPDWNVRFIIRGDLVA